MNTLKAYTIAILLVLTASGAIFAREYDSYLIFNPQIKVGTEMGDGVNESNNFIETTFGKFKYRFIDKFAVSGGGSVGFTGTAESLSANHFYNRLSLKSSYYPTYYFSAFMEGTWASLIIGSNNPVEYFPQGNYQAIGVELEGITIFDVLYGRIDALRKNPESMIQYESKLKLGKYENGNFFAELVLAKINARLNDYWSLAGGFSLGATSPRSTFSDWQYYATRFTGRVTVRPTKGVGYFLEASWADRKDSAPYSSYFASVPYIALGAEIKGISFFGQRKITEADLTKAIVKDLRKYPNSSISEIQERVGEDISKDRIRKVLKELRSKGRVIKSGERRWTRYRIK